MAPAPQHGVHLRRTEEHTEEIEALVRLCGGRTGTAGLLGDLHRRLRRSWAPGRKVHRAWTWQWEDVADRRWWPQGVTWDVETDADGVERDVLAVSWYSRNIGGLSKGSRISFVDVDRGRYRHVLLVVPSFGEDGEVTVRPLRAHAGGIVWIGPYLHVAGTARGIHTARLDDLVRVPDPAYVDDPDLIGRDGARLASFGYRYLLPVRFSYRASHDDGHEPLRYSFLSLDRTSPDSADLVVGEYGRGRQTTRLARFPLDLATHHLAASEDGYSRPLLLEEHGERGMQGAATVGDRWYVTSSRGPGLGSLYVGRPGAFREHRWALPMGPEDITWWPAQQQFWSVTEHPWLRWIYTVRMSDLD